MFDNTCSLAAGLWKQMGQITKGLDDMMRSGGDYMTMSKSWTETSKWASELYYKGQ